MNEWKVIKIQSGWPPPLRACPGERAGPVTPNWIRKNIETVCLNKKGRMINKSDAKTSFYFCGWLVPVETFSNLLHVPFCRLIIHLNTAPRPAALAPPGLRNFFPLKWPEIGPEYFGAE